MTRRRLIVIVVLLALLGLLAWWLWGRSPAPIWQPASQDYAPERCAEGDCELVLDIPLTDDQQMGLMYDPTVDDAVAQWANCLEAVVSCVEKADGAAAAYPRCVAESSCPAPCRAAFAKRSRGLTEQEQMIAALEAVFLAPDARCNPERGKAARAAAGEGK